MMNEDENLGFRQVGIVTKAGRAAAHTGADCKDWKGDITGNGFLVMGNVLAGAHAIEAMAATYGKALDDPAALPGTETWEGDHLTAASPHRCMTDGSMVTGSTEPPASCRRPSPGGQQTRRQTVHGSAPSGNQRIQIPTGV